MDCCDTGRSIGDDGVDDGKAVIVIENRKIYPTLRAKDSGGVFFASVLVR